jgi:hypothetical protein
MTNISIFNRFGALNSVPVFEAFRQGCKKHGIRVTEHNSAADVAVIWSQLWAGRMAPNQDIWQEFKSSGRPVIVMEVGQLMRGVIWKMGINGVNARAWWGEGTEPDRVKKLAMRLQPWNQGDHILIAMQRSDSEQWAGLPAPEQWLTQTIDHIREHTDRPIVVRPHPRQRLKHIPGVQIQQPQALRGTYDEFDFRSSLGRAWAVVNENSGPGSQAIIDGVPAFVGAYSMAAPVANTDFSLIEKPHMPDRAVWLEQLCHTEWTLGEIAAGLPIGRLLGRLKSL